MYNQLSSNGIVLSPTADIATDTSLKVVAITGGVRISSGIAAIQGAFAIVTDEDLLFSSDGTYKVILEFNSVLNKIYAKLSADALTRTTAVWQLQIATVVKSGTTYTVTDTRVNASLCGYANRLFDASATKIQNVPVAATAPTNLQVQAFNATSGQYEPTTTFEFGLVTNGFYKKYANGCLEVTQFVTATTNASGVIPVAYPVTFLAGTTPVPVATAQPTQSADTKLTQSAHTASGFNATLFVGSTLSNTKTHTIQYTAVGKWK